MDFKPLYLEDRVHQTDFFNPEFKKEKLNVVNKEGCAGIVTLWSQPQTIWDKLKAQYPRLFASDSPLVALSSLYGNGLPQMLANLANNPQINYLAITGNDLPVVPSYQYLCDFLSNKIELIDNGEVKMWRLGKSQFSIDSQLTPDMFKHLQIRRFPPTNLEEIVNFISQQPSQVTEDRRLVVRLIEPKFKDFPSDQTGHNIVATTPLEAWMEVMYHLDRFGINIVLPEGTRRALFNLDVNITDASFENEERLKNFGFDPENLKKYRTQILSVEIPRDTDYTYGNRLRAHWGGDALTKF